MVFSSNLNKVMTFATASANGGLIEPNHLLAGVVLTETSVGYKMLMSMIDMEDAKKKVSKLYNGMVSDVKLKPKLATLTDQIILQAALESKRSDSDLVRTEHVVLAYVKAELIKGISYDDAVIILDKVYDSLESVDRNENSFDKGVPSDGTYNQKTKVKSKTPTLDEFTTDYTDLASKGKLDSVVGREKEMRRIAQVLSRRKKNNPVLIGNPGCGKTAIVEGLAININNKNVPECLYGKRVLALEMGNIVSGTKFRGEFEERMKKIVDELKASDNIILYIDEIHTIVGAGSTAGSLDAANILKPALARGEISCIGSTTLDEYRKIEKDGALERRFQKVVVNDTTIEETRIILNNIKTQYEDYHNVEYTDEAIEACLKLTDRYVTDRSFPDKAIDAMDESGSSVRIDTVVSKELLDLELKLSVVIDSKLYKSSIQDFEGAAIDRKKQLEIEAEIEDFKKNKKDKSERRKVTAQDVAEAVAIITGIPSKNISEDDTTKLINLGKDLKSVVVGQDDAVDKIVRAVLRNKAGLSDTKKPIGSFMFMGSTGVGKTFLAKKLAEKLFTTEKDMIRIDMSEYMEKHSISRLVGAPPGYVGHEDAGQLTEAVRRKPYAIILLDEIEKAHPDVCNILLQILEDGQLTDSQGKTVDFKNTVIVMTSNVGSKESKNRGSGIGFSDTKDTLSKSVIDKALKNKFAPEFLNRIDEIIHFNPLGKEEIKSIIDLELSKFIIRLTENGLDMEIDDLAKEFLFEKGWDSDMGARPLKRAIQKYIEDEISIQLITGVIERGNKIYVTKNEGNDILTFSSSVNLLSIKLDVEEVEKV